LKAGIEGAVHAMGDIFEERSPQGWGVLLVDAANAFNSVNRAAALLNARIHWPRCARFLFNTYRGHSVLKVQNADDLLFSREGVTQGDPLSMMMYGLAVLPLIRTLAASHSDKIIQNWYADDASAAGDLLDVKKWFLSLMKSGPDYGYHPEPKKSYLVVAPEFVDTATGLFQDLGIQVVTGQRFLGGFLGNDTGKQAYMEKKVQTWCAHVEKLSIAAKDQPQAAFSALTKSLQCEWSYCQRVVADSAAFFQPLEIALKEKFLPAIFDGEVSESDRTLFSLPARLGGIGVRNPVLSAPTAYATSRDATSKISDAIHSKNAFSSNQHAHQLQAARKKFKESQKASDSSTLDTTLATFSPPRVRALRRIIDGKTSRWLTVLPIAKNHFDLSCSEFRDALCLRYQRGLLRSPATCDGCDASFSVSHAISCKKGGLIVRRHNEVRDALGDLCSLVWKDVVREPVIREANPSTNEPALVADLGVRGVWRPQTLALFDVRVMDTDAMSYVSTSVESALSNAERCKKTKYSAACEQRRASFTPFVVSVDGALGKEANAFIQRLSSSLAVKWDISYSTTCSWIQTRLAFAVLRATNQCIRGSRTKWRGLGGDDGAFLFSALKP
jgi:hypothetical protein